MDLSARGTRFVVLESSLRRSEIIAADHVLRGQDEAGPDYWERVRERLPTDIDTVLVAAQGSGISTRMLTFPFGDPRKVEQTIDFELETQIPYDLEDVLSAWVITQKSKNETKILTAITPKARLASVLAELAESELEPRGLVVPGATLTELLPEGTAADTVAVVAMGARETHVTVAGGRGEVKFTRTIRVGGELVDRTLAKELGISVDDARRRRETEGRLVSPDEAANGDAELMSAQLTKGMAPLLSQLAATLKALPPDLSPARLLLTGGLSRLPGLDQHVAATLGLPVELLDLKSALGDVVCERPLGPEYAVPLGLALAQSRRGRGLPLNLRRGEFAYSGDFALYRKEITRVGVGLALLMGLAMLGSIVRYTLVTSEEAEITQAICSATKKIVDREICDPTMARSVINSAPAGDDGVFIPDYTAATLFEMMSRAIPADLSVTFENLDFKLEGATGEPDRITGKGDADSFESTEQLVSSLRKDPCVQEAEILKQKRGKSDRVEFNLRVAVKCPAGKIPGSELEALAQAGPTPTSGAARPAAKPVTSPAEAAPSTPPAPKTPRSVPPQSPIRSPMQPRHQLRPQDRPFPSSAPTPFNRAEALQRLRDEGGAAAPDMPRVRRMPPGVRGAEDRSEGVLRGPAPSRRIPRPTATGQEGGNE